MPETEFDGVIAWRERIYTIGGMLVKVEALLKKVAFQVAFLLGSAHCAQDVVLEKREQSG